MFVHVYPYTHIYIHMCVYKITMNFSVSFQKNTKKIEVTERHHPVNIGALFQANFSANFFYRMLNTSNLKYEMPY